jgi:hypothetical protein
MPRSYKGVSDVYQGRSDFLAHSGGNGCSCSPQVISDILRKEWRPSHCKMIEWNAEGFCKTLGNRKMLFIGDSLMEQASSHTMNAVFTAGCQTQMFMGLSDTLIKKPLGNYNRGLYWKDLVALVNADIVVMNAWAHIYGDSNFSNVLSEVAEGIRDLRSKDSSFHAIWMTSQPGGCAAFNETYASIPGPIPGPFHEYQYDDCMKRDIEAKSLFRNENVPVLDMRIFYSRGDAKTRFPKSSGHDCLHSCLPGALDIFPALLWQLLLDLENKFPERL